MSEEEKRPKIERLGKYEVVKEIGHGGMARVFKARNDETGELVAVKVLMPELTSQPAFIKRFRREINTLRGLDHPNIVKVLDVGSEDLYQFYVMELMDGPSLEQLLRTRMRFEADETLAFARAVAAALEHAHIKGIIHRDIKPANIMTDSAGNVKLADFGIAREIEATRLTVTGGIVGTADYMSPEQAEGKRVTRRSDIYSLGVCLYEMLTGKVPFTGKTYLDVIRAHRFQLPESPKLLNPSIPGRVASLVESMMEKDPDKRPSSAGEVISRMDAIEHVTGGMTEHERETAKEMIRWALFPAADWKTYLLRGATVIALVAGVVLAAWGLRYRYFTSPAYKLSHGMEAFRGGDYDKAIRYFEDVMYYHGGTPEAASAEKRLAEVRYLNYRKRIASRKKSTKPEATELYEHAEGLLAGGHKKEAIEWLRLLATDFADTEGGELAAAKLQELQVPKTDETAPVSSDDTPSKAPVVPDEGQGTSQSESTPGLAT